MSLLLNLIRSEWQHRRRPHPIASRRTPPPRRTVYAVRRDSDGRYWAGPYKYQGRTFTTTPNLIYVWGSRKAAESALLWGGWRGVTVVEADHATITGR